jgi:hypothetical protein
MQLNIVICYILRLLHMYLRYKSKVIRLRLMSLLLWVENKETLLPLADITHTLVGCFFLHESKCCSLSPHENYDQMLQKTQQHYLTALCSTN